MIIFSVKFSLIFLFSQFLKNSSISSRSGIELHSSTLEFLITSHPNIHRYIVWQSKSVMKNKKERKKYLVCQYITLRTI